VNKFLAFESFWISFPCSFKYIFWKIRLRNCHISANYISDIQIYINWVSRHLPAVAWEVGIMPHQPQEILKSILEKFAIMALSATLQSRALFIDYTVWDILLATTCVLACVRAQRRKWEDGGRRYVLSSLAIETKGRQNEQKN